jgi:hypothetical protein
MLVQLASSSLFFTNGSPTELNTLLLIVKPIPTSTTSGNLFIDTSLSYYQIPPTADQYYN